MWSTLLLITLTSLTAESATVTSLDGKSVPGAIVALDATGLTLRTATGEEKFAVENLQSVRAQAVLTRPTPEVVVQLADGSQLFGAEFQLEASRAILIGLDGVQVVLPRRAIRWARFQGSLAVSAGDWQEALSTQAAGDLLVVRKSGAKDATGGTKMVLDPLEGTVKRVGNGTIGFDFDGDEISVKAEKVEGIVFFRPTEPANPQLICKVSTASWGVLQASEVAWIEGNLQLKSPSGVSLRIPWTAGTVLDYRAGNIQWLAELESDTVRTAFHFQPSGMTIKFADLFSPDANGPFGGNGLKLGKQTFESGLSLHSPTTLTYRIPEGFAKFRANLGLVEEVSAAANLQFRILADQRVVFERTIAATDAREPVEVECDLAGARRFTIEVAAGNGLDIGDTIILGDARFVK